MYDVRLQKQRLHQQSENKEKEWVSSTYTMIEVEVRTFT